MNFRKILIRKTLGEDTYQAYKLTKKFPSVNLPIVSRLTQKGFYLHEKGWIKSISSQESVDADGNPLPWITYPAIHFLSSRVNPNMRVFEYGSGNSTLWWSDKVKKVHSCEHNSEYYKKLKPHLPDNVNLSLVPLVYGGAYSKAIQSCDERFDVVVIDGRDRVNCAKNCLNRLKKEGIIIWDNTDREAYREGYDYLKRFSFKQIQFCGMSPINVSESETSIFYRNNNCLGI